MNRLRYSFLAGLAGVKVKSFNHNTSLDEEKSLKISPTTCSIITEERQNNINKAQECCLEYMKKHQVPGMVVAVSCDGEMIWKAGFGERDVENNVECDGKTSMLISSISKPLVALVLFKLYQHHLVDLDKDIRTYVPQFPPKTFDDNEATITLRQLLSHTSGIRHYKDDNESVIQQTYDGVIQSLDIFKHDQLLSKPGDKFEYSTFAYTLISAAMENISGINFVDLMLKYLRNFRMNETFPNDEEKIIYHRSRYYNLLEDEKLLINAPYVNCSYKWAGGGFTSTVTDLIRFANLMMFSFQNLEDAEAILEHETVEMMWTPVTVQKDDENMKRGYGLGWRVEYLPEKEGYNLFVYHTGAGSGNSCVLLMKMSTQQDMFHDTNHKQHEVISDSNMEEKERNLEQMRADFDEATAQLYECKGVEGIAVAIVTNLNDLRLVDLAKKLATAFGVEDSDEMPQV